MARVSISEAARLVKVSRPTIYKMINSGRPDEIKPENGTN